MIKSLEKSIIVDYPCEDYWWELFGFCTEEDAERHKEELARKMLPHIRGWCQPRKGSKTRYVLAGVNCKECFFEISSKIVRALKLESQHQDERIKDGVSFKDAWNVDAWLADKCSKILRILKENTHSFPSDEKRYHDKFLELDEKPQEMSDDDYDKLTEGEKSRLCQKWFAEDLERMAFLFEQWLDDKCAEKNQYDFKLHFKFTPIKEGPDKGLSRLDFEGTQAERDETDKHSARELEIEAYKSKCLHKAISMLNIYIETLWD